MYDKELLTQIIFNLPDYVFWKDKELIYQGCNRNFAQYAGYDDPKALIGKTDQEMPWGPYTGSTYQEEDRQVLSTGKPMLCKEVPMELGEKKKRILSVSKVPLYQDSALQGKIIGILGIYQDITDKKKLEHQLLLSKAREARFKAMSALGGMIAHELRTPLAALKGTAVAIQKALPKLIRGYQMGLATGQVEEPLREDLFEALQQSIADMGQRVDYAQATITTILTGLHYTSSLEIPEVQPLSLPSVVQKAIEQYPFTAAQKAWVTVHPLDMTEVIGEEQIIIHVLHNLLKNALYAIASVDKGRVTIRSAVKKDHYCLYFEDTAKGIPAEQLPRIFEAFYTTKAKGAESIGLGLYFCKMALKRMQADIQCESEVGKYARFTITIPLSRAGQRVGR